MALTIVQAVFTNEYVQYDGSNANEIVDHFVNDQLSGEILSESDGSATIRLSYWPSGTIGQDQPERQILQLIEGDWLRQVFPYVQVIHDEEFSSCYFIKNT